MSLVVTPSMSVLGTLHAAIWRAVPTLSRCNWPGEHTREVVCWASSGSSHITSFLRWKSGDVSLPGRVFLLCFLYDWPSGRAARPRGAQKPTMVLGSRRPTNNRIRKDWPCPKGRRQRLLVDERGKCWLGLGFQGRLRSLYPPELRGAVDLAQWLRSRSGRCWGSRRWPQADLSPTTDFMLLGLNWPIVKFVLEQIYFVPE